MIPPGTTRASADAGDARAGREGALDSLGSAWSLLFAAGLLSYQLQALVGWLTDLNNVPSKYPSSEFGTAQMEPCCHALGLPAMLDAQVTKMLQSWERHRADHTQH